jgi:hypothetical protein
VAHFTPQTFGVQLQRMVVALGAKAMTDACGEAAKKEAEKAASADLGGDPKFSGWAPELVTRYDVIRPGRISFHPTRRSAGPWTVAEFGRNSTEGPRMTGPRLTKTGRISKARVKRYNGRTPAFHTATEALDLIEKRMPHVVNDEVGHVLRKFFD